jgi:hypothetical protein
MTPSAATAHDGVCLSQALLDLGAAMARAGSD